MSTHYRFVVSCGEKGIKLLTFLREKLPPLYSVKALKRAIDGKQCRINEKIERFSTSSLREGDEVALLICKEKPAPEIDILFEDEHLLICNKPAMVLSEERFFTHLSPGLKLVHRLDKETSGTLILAKERSVLESMTHLFVEKKIAKNYYALVAGEVKKKRGEIKSWLYRKKKVGGQVFWSSSPLKKGLEAHTRWQVIEARPKGSLLLCQPVTGKTHQLRVHLSEMEHPLIGDIQYGKERADCFGILRQMLHAYSISFVHPVKKTRMEVIAPFPADFLHALAPLKIKPPCDRF